MRKITAFVMAIMACFNLAQANDGVFFARGSFLVPIYETDIAAAKEILTITIGTDNYATIDVYYEFMNNGQAKTVKMAFEAIPQYNDIEPMNRNGVHPYIKDFVVNMNGMQLPYKNNIVAFFGTSDERSNDLVPLDITQWKSCDEMPDSIVSGELYNPALDSIIPYAYAYCFDAPFKQGLNIVHHTYRYRMSYNVSEVFNIPYWLTPATRWANRQVDDFTLIIKAEDTTEFCLANSLFSAAPFVSAKGCEIYHLTSEFGENFIFTTLFPDDTITWHCHNFSPKTDMSINAPSWGEHSVLSKCTTSAKVVVDAQGNEYRYLADSGDNYFVEAQDYATVPKKGCSVKEYSAQNGQGYLVINGEAARRVNVRQRPTTRSSVICTIGDTEGELPEVYPCLGVSITHDDSMWYKTKVNGKIGYIRQNLMLWNAINTY